MLCPFMFKNDWVPGLVCGIASEGYFGTSKR